MNTTVNFAQIVKNAPVYLWTFTPLFRDVVVVSDLNKNIGGSTDLAEKKARIGRFAYPYSPSPLIKTLALIVSVQKMKNVSRCPSSESPTQQKKKKTDNSMCDVIRVLSLVSFGEHIDEVEWRPEQFRNNNCFTFPGRISVLSPCGFGDKNGSKRPLPEILSSEISLLKLRKTFETTDSLFLGSKCNRYFEVVFARPHRVERGIVKHTMMDYTRNSRQNI